jgi:serine/threonine protein kinase/WD40 repeat protein
MIKPGDEPIAGYRIEELLGQGQFGQVWRARSPGNMSLALKFLSLTGRHGWKEFRAIQRVKQIRHAHLMPIVAIWLLDEKGAIISDDAVESIAADHRDLDSASPSSDTIVAPPIRESARPAQMIVATLVANQTLGDRLKECQAAGKRGIPADELLQYMAEAAKGLDFLNSSRHQIGDSRLGAVQHCDVKPDNIMLSGGSVVICDFGVAQVLAGGRDVNATSLGGTPAYMAPECFMSKPSSCSDQYSLAVTYYQLRTGRLPFTEETFAAVYAAHQDGTLDFRAASKAEQAVLRRATSPDPAARYASCSEFAEALRAAVHPLPKRPTRGKAWALSLTLIAAAVGAAAVVTFLDWGDEPNVDKATANNDQTEKDKDAISDDAPPVENKAAIAAQFARKADELLAADNFDDAVAALAEAIRRDPATYAQLPQPELRPTDGGEIHSLILSNSGESVVAVSKSGAIRRWRLDARSLDESEEASEGDGGIVAAAAADQWVASHSPTTQAITVVPTRGEAFNLPLADKDSEVRILAAAGQGRWLVAATESFAGDPLPRWTTSLLAWDMEAGDVAGSRREVIQSEEGEAVLAAAGAEPWIALSTLRIGDDGQDVSVVRQCWLDSNRQRVVHRQPSSIRAVAVSLDDRWIAVGGGLKAGGNTDEADFSSAIIDAHGQHALDEDAAETTDAAGESQQLQWGHYDQISAIAFDQSGQRLITGARDGVVHVWRIPDGWIPAQRLGEKPLFLNQPSRTNAVRQLASPRAGWIAAAYDQGAALWYADADNPTPLWLGEETDEVTAMTATADGAWLITGHPDGAIRFWPARRLMLVDRACAAAGEKPRAGKTDQVTRYDRSSPSARRSPSARARTASGPLRRPTGGPA